MFCLHTVRIAGNSIKPAVPIKCDRFCRFQVPICVVIRNFTGNGIAVLVIRRKHFFRSAALSLLGTVYGKCTVASFTGSNRIDRLNFPVLGDRFRDCSIFILCLFYLKLFVSVLVADSHCLAFSSISIKSKFFCYVFVCMRFLVNRAVSKCSVRLIRICCNRFIPVRFGAEIFHPAGRIGTVHISVFRKPPFRIIFILKKRCRYFPRRRINFPFFAGQWPSFFVPSFAFCRNIAVFICSFFYRLF